MPIVKIISGGQTGVDQIALDTAIHCRIPHGGWCPKGRRSENGQIPPIYSLTEHPSSGYPARTEANVVDSDATLLITPGQPAGGSLLTAQLCRKHHKPWLHIDLLDFSEKQAAERTALWLQGEDPGCGTRVLAENCILNVAGSRGSRLNIHPHVITNLLLAIIHKVNGTFFYSLRVPPPFTID